MCKSCVIPGCSVLIVGNRDLCRKHFEKLPEGDRQRLDDLLDDGREVYAAVLAAAVEKLTAKPIPVNAWGYPVGPVMA